jgi:hypothetical protein
LLYLFSISLIRQSPGISQLRLADRLDCRQIVPDNYKQ